MRAPAVDIAGQALIMWGAPPGASAGKQPANIEHSENAQCVSPVRSEGRSTDWLREEVCMVEGPLDRKDNKATFLHVVLNEEPATVDVPRARRGSTVERNQAGTA